MPRFDTFPIAYLVPVYVLCWGLLWLTTRSGLGVSRLAFLGLALGTLLLLRLPSIVHNAEINPDESQMIAQAMTLRQDPVYFRSVDGTTGGPLDSYFLILPNVLGLPFDYIMAHLTAFGLVALCFALLFQTARLWFGERAARLALLPLVFTFGLTRNGDFLHYNSELIALVLLCGSCYRYAVLLRTERPSWNQIGLLGFFLGMVPFGKLQAVPMAVVIGLFVLIDILMRQNLTHLAKAGRLAALIGFGLLFPLAAVALIWINGVYEDFVLFYLIGNLRYAGDSNQVQNLLHLPVFFEKGNEFAWLVWFTVLIWVIGFGSTLRRGIRLGKSDWRIGGFIGGLLVATLLAITRTGSEYVHYLYFLIGPLLLGLAYGWQQIRINIEAGHWLGMGATALFLALFGWQGIVHMRQQITLNPYPSDKQVGWTIPSTPVSRVISKWGKPGEKLVVWGWRCDYYVQTQMPQGVAENHTIRSGFSHPLQAIYQQRYIRDFVRSFPPVFVDAVGGQNLWMTNRQTQGHEIIKPLGRFVADHYCYVGLVNDTRIYVRSDRVKEKSARQTR